MRRQCSLQAIKLGSSTFALVNPPSKRVIQPYQPPHDPNKSQAIVQIEETLFTQRCTWQIAVTLFDSMTSDRNTRDLVPSASTLALFSQVLLINDVVDRYYGGDFEALLQEIRLEIGGDEDSRWFPSPQEIASFVRYKSRYWQRHRLVDVSLSLERSAPNTDVAKPLTSCATTVIPLEGRDDRIVSNIEFQLQRRWGSVTIEHSTLSDLMYLSIRWTTALRLLGLTEVRTCVKPLQEMYVRTIGLMTSYSSGFFGVSRPWRLALQLYTTACTVHVPSTELITVALDALSSSVSNFVKLDDLVPLHSEFVWEKCLQLLSAPRTYGNIASEDETHLCEALVHLSAVIGNWQLALTTLASMDISSTNTSNRVIVPTAETLAFAVIAVRLHRRDADVSQLLTYFESMYHYHSLPVEVILPLLKSLFQHPIHAMAPKVLSYVIVRGGLLCGSTAILCLTLLKYRVPSFDEKIQPSQVSLVKSCLDSFFSSLWDFRPDVRHNNFRMVFEAVHRIGAEFTHIDTDVCNYTLSLIRKYCGGIASDEENLFRVCRICRLQYEPTWESAVSTYANIVVPMLNSDAVVLNNSVATMLPLSLQATKLTLVQSLLSFACRGVNVRYRVAEDNSPAVSTTLSWLRALQIVAGVYSSKCDALPHMFVARFIKASMLPHQLMSSPCKPQSSGDKVTTGARLEAFMAHFALSSAAASQRMLDRSSPNEKLEVTDEAFIAEETGLSYDEAQLVLQGQHRNIRKTLIEQLVVQQKQTGAQIS